jgi:hypothetical protein
LTTALRLLDPLVFASVWPGLVAAALMLATASALDAPLDPALAAFGFCGTLIVYNVDRLRDLERDRLTSPSRSRFVERNRGRLVALVAAAAAVCALTLPSLPAAGLTLCAAVVGLGFFHRRLKRLTGLKIAYVTLSWVAVTVGLPAIALAAAPGAALQVGAIVGLAVAANLSASDLRDREAGAKRVPERVVIGLACASCALGVGLALGGPPARAPLCTIPGLELLAIAGLEALPPGADRERYGHAVIDGALWIGAALSILWMGQ